MSPDFAERSTEAEIMDTVVTGFADFDECLRHIEIVNRLTLGYRPVLSWLKKILLPVSPKRPLTIIDVGSGRGEMLRQVWKLARREKIPVHLTGIDINPWSTAAAEKATPADVGIHYETSNIFAMDTAQKADFIISTHFTHHLGNDELVRFLRWMDDHSVQGWFINDLHRHKAPYLFIKYVLPLVPINKMSRNDGPVSVARAFTAADWRRALQQAGIPPAQSRIRWFFPFRYGVARWKSGQAGVQAGSVRSFPTDGWRLVTRLLGLDFYDWQSASSARIDSIGVATEFGI
jgi:2-polyprenyl-3-methyl-5-hydroxy-6-metoxy-1,4-benzoquinol methylase